MSDLCVRILTCVFFAAALTACGGSGSSSGSAGANGGVTAADSELVLPSQLEVVTVEGGNE